MKLPPAAARLLACLGDPSRFLLVRVLSAGRRCVTELALDVGLSQSCTTRHLQALERAGLVRGTREGRRVTFGLNQEHVSVADLIAWALRHESEVVEDAPAARPGGTSRTARTRRRRRFRAHPRPPRDAQDRGAPEGTRPRRDPLGEPSGAPAGTQPGPRQSRRRVERVEPQPEGDGVDTSPEKAREQSDRPALEGSRQPDRFEELEDFLL